MLDELTRQLFAAMEASLQSTQPRLVAEQFASLRNIGTATASITGLDGLQADELIALPDGVMAIAANIDQDQAGLILLGNPGQLTVGAKARRSRRAVDTPVGDMLLGRVVDALGRPLDNLGRLAEKERRAINQPAPPIIHRAPVQVPLQTGIKAIDAAIPIGRGQRELIIGDRQTGKTAIAVDTMLNQTGRDVICIYCAIGQRASAVARVIEALRHSGAIDHCIIVVANGDDAPGLQYIAPYAATSMGEYFMRRGRDVLVVYDDLTRHARAYRELSLLLRRPPGREAYPGDIFYIHARLLERATHLRDEHGGGSLTALPIIETQAQNISAYIPTNLISITDGQIYLSPNLFERGHLPAIDIGKSVSRVGGKAQLPAYRTVAGDLRLSYSQFEELESFARFGTRLDEDTRRKLQRGRRVREVLKQRQQDPMTVTQQIAVLLAATSGVLDDVALENASKAAALIRDAATEQLESVAQRIDDGEKLSDDDKSTIIDMAKSVLAEHDLRKKRDD
ncbi:MAG: alternate F1F0 ATPase, F1 subunit alpha [Sphingomonadales bacterium]